MVKRAFSLASNIGLPLILSVAALYLGAHLLSWAGTTTTHITCSGTAVQTFEGEKTRFSDSRLGIRVDQYSPIVFWAKEDQELSFSMTYIEPNGPARRWTENFLPLNDLNETFFATEMRSEKDTQFFYDNLSGYVSVMIPDDQLPLAFDGFCETFEPAF